MKYPDIVQRNINDLFNQHRELSSPESTDDQRRALTKMIIEQTIFDLPDGNFGWKASSPSNPPSKDVLAKHTSHELIGWDLFNGATREPNEFPESISLEGQFFIELEGKNHLNHPIANPPGNPVDETPNDHESRVEVYLLDIIEHQKELVEMINRASLELQTLVKNGIPIRFK